MVLAVVTLALLTGVGAWWLLGDGGRAQAGESSGSRSASTRSTPSSAQEPTGDATATSTAVTRETPEDASDADAPATHVTFGSHTTANQPCVSCHPKTRSDEIACRSCHGFDCGEDAKTMADCLKCHQTGTTDEWVTAKQ